MVIQVKNNLALFIMLLFVVVAFNACQKPDTLNPVLTIIGPSPYYVSLGQHYNDPGASVTDNKTLENIGVTGNANSSNPNVNRTGIYIITYYATDKDGNTGYTSRTVIVKNDADVIQGNYNVTDTINTGSSLSYMQTIAVDTAKNKRARFTKFANYDNTNIYGDLNVSMDSITIPDQVANKIGKFISENHKFKGKGVIKNGNIIINYTDINLTNPDTTTGVAYYIKQ
jgi:hypothetical protein